MHLPIVEAVVAQSCVCITARPFDSARDIGTHSFGRSSAGLGLMGIATLLLVCLPACNAPTPGAANGGGGGAGTMDAGNDANDQGGDGSDSGNGNGNAAGGDDTGGASLELSNAIVRQLAEGDRWAFEERQENTSGGETIETVGTHTYEVLEGVFDDAGGNAVRALSATYDAVVEGAGQSVRTLFVYFSQDAEGTVLQHGRRNEYVNPPEERFVASPLSGKYATIASPLAIGDMQTWDVLFDDGARLTGESHVLAIEERPVPAGTFVAARIAISETETSASGTASLEATLWYVPALGREVLAEYESRSGEGESLSITTGTRELLETNIVLQDPADEDSAADDADAMDDDAGDGGAGDGGAGNDGMQEGDDPANSDDPGAGDDSATDDGGTDDGQGGDGDETPPGDPTADDPPDDEGTIELFDIPEDAEFITTETGLEYYHLEEGTGDQPNPDSVVRVAYIGFLTDGTVFDANDDVVFDLTGLISGFTEGLTLMREGGSTRLVIPPELGYGPGGNPGAGIGGEDIILFDVVLIEIDVL